MEIIRLPSEKEFDPVNLFQHDTILPSQFFVRTTVSSAGEQELKYAILIDALKCFERFLNGNRSRDARLANDWIFNESEDDPFSFDNICDELGLNSSCLRSGLRKMQKEWTAKKDRKKRIRSIVHHCAGSGSIKAR